MPAKKLIRVRVIKHLPLGLSVEAEDGTRGIIRLRELSWGKDQLRYWESSFPVDWSGDAFRLSSKKGHTPEFSLRLSEDDPLDELLEKDDVRRVFRGIVSGVMEYGAFVDIVPGVTGLLHRSQLPEWAGTASPTEVFWLGDRVNVTIKEIKRKERQVSLGLAPVSSLPNGSRKSSEPEHRAKKNTDDLDAFIKADVPKRHVLVVEDEPEQSSAVSDWLQRLGQRVDVLDSAEKALDYLNISQPDMALIDVGLPGMNGAELAAIILDRFPQIRVISTTDWTRADDMIGILDALQDRGVELIIKPILPEDLIVLLEKPKEDISYVKPVNAKPLSLDDISVPKLSDSLQNLLRRCRKQVGFGMVILFCFDPNHRVVTMVDHTGELFLDKSAVPSLIYSPVRDVAEDRVEVVLNEIQPLDQDRFRYLLELVPLTVSCLGVPVPAELQLEYALFVIDKRPHQISREQKVFVEAMALVIAAWLEQNKFKEQSALIQRTALIGHLTRAMVHEINNLVGPLSSRLDDLQTSLARLEKRKDTENQQESRSLLIVGALEEIQKNFKKIVSTTRMFRRVVAKGRNEILRMDEIVQETIDLLRDTSDRYHINIVFNPPSQLVIVRNQAAALEQILLNVMLNALQQIAEIRPNTGGWVHVWIEQNCDSGSKGFLRILIEDNGPGIHASMKEKIFDAGFSTREDGSGIGLYISRNLINDMGGKIYVRESFVLGGTTFALEIPCQL
jgi:signal transduction histidine kinase/predicted RNA-binding protein with RPS1 domain